MNNLTLYLMLGYPGAGKTSVSKKLATATGAIHIWADHERRAMFGNPTHSQSESQELYTTLDAWTDKLLGEGRSVIFDTSFNHFKDREYLRSIASKHAARVVLVWLTTPRAIAKARATHQDHANHNKYEETMSSEEFERIASHLEPPRPEEQAIEIDGTDLNAQTLHVAISQLM